MTQMAMGQAAPLALQPQPLGKRLGSSQRSEFSDVPFRFRADETLWVQDQRSRSILEQPGAAGSAVARADLHGRLNF